MIKASKIQAAGLLVTVASLTWSPFGTSVGIGLLALSWIVSLVTKTTTKPQNKILPFGLIVGFVWCALGVLWSSNFIEGLIVAKIKLPLLIVPLSLCFVPRDNSQDKLIASIFIVSTCTAAIVGIIWGKYIDPGNFSPFISHIRMGLILALGSGLLLLTNKWKYAALYILIAFVEVWYTRCVTGIGMLAFSILFSVAQLSFPKDRISSTFCTFSVLIGISIAVFISIMPSDFKDQKLSKTPWGGSYVHYPEKHMEENGHKVWMNLASDEMRVEWNLRSSIPFDSLDANGHKIETTLIRFLTSKGKPKNGLEVKKLSPKEITFVESGHTSIRMSTHSGLSLRLDDLKFEIGNYLDGGSPDGNSVTMRFEAYKAAWRIIKMMDLLSIFLGEGTGDLSNELKKSYLESNSELSEKFWINTHNQYIAWWIGCGLVGLALWLIALYGSWIQGGYISRLAWWIVVISCLTEDTLETQAGVTFTAIAMVVFGMSYNKKN